MESLHGLRAVRTGLHPCGGLHHLPPPGLGAVCGDPGLPGCVHRSNAGNAAAVLQLPEQVHRGHEVQIQYCVSLYRSHCLCFEVQWDTKGSGGVWGLGIAHAEMCFYIILFSVHSSDFNGYDL